MKVKFYTFTKKYDSTAQPTGGTEYDCVLKTSSSVIKLNIELQLGLTTNPSAYNYCYISSYGRYYWVSEWTFSNHLWIATCEVDVLASWKTYIGNTDMYVYRSSASYDGKIIDTKYPTTTDVTISKVDITPRAKRFSDGYFVVGVYGDNTNNTTMAYYSIRASNFGTFLHEIFTRGVADDGIWGTVAKGVRNAIFDISSFIKSCKWFPLDPGQLSTSSTIQVGSLTINCTNAKVVDSSLGYSFSYGAVLAIPKHPQASTRGVYCNMRPYSRYKIVLLPFGVFELDTSLLAKYDYLSYVVDVDGVSGMGVLSLYVCTDNLGSNAQLILTKTCNYGVDIPISVTQTNLPSIASSLAGAGVSAMHGNIASFATSFFASVADMAIPSQDAINDSMGSLIGIDYSHNRLMGIFYPLVDEDLQAYGRPLCKVKKPSTISGYIQGEYKTFAAPATLTEMEEIKNFINNGFYYE